MKTYPVALEPTPTQAHAFTAASDYAREVRRWSLITLKNHTDELPTLAELRGMFQTATLVHPALSNASAPSGLLDHALRDTHSRMTYYRKGKAPAPGIMPLGGFTLFRVTSPADPPVITPTHVTCMWTQPIKVKGLVRIPTDGKVAASVSLVLTGGLWRAWIQWAMPASAAMEATVDELPEAYG